MNNPLKNYQDLNVKQEGEKFYKISLPRRRKQICEDANIPLINFLKYFAPNSILKTKYSYLDKLSECVIGEFVSPLSIVRGMQINDKLRNIPLCTEETSVVAAINRIAKLSRSYSFYATADDPYIEGHISYYAPTSDKKGKIKKWIILHNRAIKDIIKQNLKKMEARGGGLRNIYIDETQKFVNLVIGIDPRDSMGANKLTQILYKISKYIEGEIKKTSIVDIVSNSLERTVHAEINIPIESMYFNNMEGRKVAHRLLLIQELAREYPNRRATHIKGLLNGLSAILKATAQDDRAIWAAMMDYINTRNIDLFTHFEIKNKIFSAQIKLPMLVSTVGTPMVHEQSRFLIKKILDIKGCNDLSQIIACVGLASVLAACTALVTKNFADSYQKLNQRKYK